MALEKWTWEDSFDGWKRKTNLAIDAIDNIQIRMDTPTAFSYLANETTGLQVKFLGGKVRDASRIDTIPTTTLTLNPIQTNIVCIYKKGSDQASLKVYTTTTLPNRYVIPIWQILTNVSNVTGNVDLRTPFTTSAGSSSQSSAVLQIDKNVTENVTIDATQNGLSIDPIIQEGVTVTVSETSKWVVL